MGDGEVRQSREEVAEIASVLDVNGKYSGGGGGGHLSLSIRKRLHSLPGHHMRKEPFTIFRAPAHVREANKILYEPRMVSIGPYHRGAKGLRAMEDHKWRYLRDFLHRCRSTDQLDLYVERMKECEKEARRCYVESTDLTSDDFVEMLLLDGCFILEFLNKWQRDDDDTMRDVGWSLPLIRSDLLLLDNQIPFFVLLKLFSHHDGGGAAQKPGELQGLMVDYLMRAKLGSSPAVLENHQICHLLHLYHACLAPSSEIAKRKRSSRGSATSHRDVMISVRGAHAGIPRAIPCAAQLRLAGVVFKKKRSDNFLDVTFAGGVMEIPHLSIEESTKSRLMNAVVFEQCFASPHKFMSGYACFMDSIVNTTEDVAVLQECGVLDNNMASGEEAAEFFNQLSRCCFIDKESHFLTDLFIDVVEYCNSDWHRYRAKLMHDYFGNPWAILSLGAALILLFLTMIQTFFSAFAYFRPPA